MPSFRDSLAGLLKEKKYDEALGLIRGRRGAVRTLMGLLFDQDDLVRWRAVTMFGLLAEAEPELVRPRVFHMLYSLSEESSVVGWGSAQAIGEIARKNPEVARHAIRPVIHYMDDDELSHPANRNTALLVGSIWATGNLAGAQPELSAEMSDKLLEFLDDPSGDVRGHCVWALGEIAASGGGPADTGKIEKLLDDKASVNIYINGDLTPSTVGELARKALALMKGRGR